MDSPFWRNKEKYNHKTEKPNFKMKKSKNNCKDYTSIINYLYTVNCKYPIYCWEDITRYIDGSNFKTFDGACTESDSYLTLSCFDVLCAKKKNKKDLKKKERGLKNCFNNSNDKLKSDNLQKSI